ncbi:sensor histidine kinase [Tetragenococcus halophilus]|uniref:sensor histidine kinase n=1 Tax=Tetragenococcus halophilus TaxID=51669 RepID=UPI000CBA6CED|nr:sensor histidine kinase [Tetragenococcus halophilus]MCO8285341.1 sensor histidine kinase [Tetragenococcus halophilus]GBD66213.1 two-component histidine kinase [Tetragenococcus halophilus subsp. halophilus]GBD77171.1 two-component histidine kinase [Tetragenococcus halophilus subsp. halophilus]GFK24507.1 two-component system sensor histidine kinase [Tetragenococcus halophilus]GFK29097.1 two-component system sensor histidine kinase [Tetragenococcus halophilus]
MTDKKTRKMLSAFSSLFALLMMLIVLFFYMLGTDQTQPWLQLFQVRIAYVPLIFYIIGIALGCGLVTFVVFTYFQKKEIAPIAEKLRLLVSGNFKDTSLNHSDVYSDESKELTMIHQDIFQITEKLKDMSSELQELNTRPQYIDGQTKEEILASERHRLARELHDSVSQELFAAMMMMSAVTEKTNESAISEAQQKQLQMISSIINNSQSEMRALLLHLRPVTLEEKSLKKGIEQLLRELQSKIKLSLKWDIEDVDIPRHIEDQLFRVIQELLSNTLRHSKANELEVYLHLIEENVLLRVVDDGVGFNPDQKESAGSYGLRNVRERIAAVGGTVKVISFKNQGTSIEIKIPLIKEGVNK